MNNKGRVLTVRLTIEDPEAADWIWKAYPNPINGITISALSNGDMFAERDMLANAACFYIREEGETTEEAVQAHMGEAFDSPESAATEARKSYEKEKWDIIDSRGNVVRSSQ